MNNAFRFADIRIGRFYLPAVALGYLFVQTSTTLLLYFAVGCLMAAVWHHGILAAAAGFGGWWENPKWRREKHQRIQAVLWDYGRADDYPESFITGVFNQEYHRPRRYPLLVFGSVLTFVLIAGYAVAMWGLYQRLSQLDFPGLLIFFALILVLLRFLMWRFFPAVFYQEEMEDEPNNDPHLIETISGFGRYFASDENIQVNDLQFNVVDGGVLKLEYETDREIGDEIEGEFSAAAFGFVGFVERLDYPVARLDVEFEDTGGREGSFSIEGEWARKMSNQDLGQEEYLEKVVRGIEVEGGEFKVPEENVH